MNAERFHETLHASRVIAVASIEDPDDAFDMAVALAGGGLPMLEITLRTERALEAIECASACDDALVGAGSIRTGRDVDRAVAAGATFIVSPGLSAGVVQRCRELGVITIPGVATASDLMAAVDLGLHLVKFFPAEALGGLGTLSALAAPFPDMRFIPTGGITVDSLPSYLMAPYVAGAGGSWMVSRSLVEAKDWDAIAAQAGQVRQTVADQAYVNAAPATT